jgi:hypothetical protein
MMKNSILLKVLALLTAMLLASSGWGFETNKNSLIKGNLTLDPRATTDPSTPAGNLTVAGELKIAGVDTTSTGIATTIDIEGTSDDSKLPTVSAVRNLKVPSFCASDYLSNGNRTVDKNSVFTGSEVFDTTNDYSTTGKFKAPIAGIYHFIWTAFSNKAGRTALYKKTSTNNNPAIYMQRNYSATSGHSLSALVSLSINDEVHLAGVGDTANDSMQYYAGRGHNMFCGYLVHLLSESD